VGELKYIGDRYPNTLKVKVQKVLKCLTSFDENWFLRLKCSSLGLGLERRK
jgi:hypothetical protein